MLSQDESIVADKLVQRINLVKFISKPQEVYLSFNQILQACALVVIIFLGYSLYGYWEQVTLNKHITKLRLQSAGLIGKTTSENAKEMQLLAGNDAVYAVLQKQYAKNGLGFSNYLESIAAACPSGVWLTSINIKKRPNVVVLLGKAYYPNNIMQLVGNLNRDSLFSGTPFFFTKIEKLEGQKSGYSFILQTKDINRLKA